MPRNASKPQELVICAQTRAYNLGETEQIQSSLPLTWGVHTEGRDGFSFPKCWILADFFFERGCRYLQVKKVMFGGCGPAPTLPGWLHSSLLPIPPMEATENIASTGSGGGSEIPGSHPLGHPGSGSAWGHPQHKWQLFPWGTILKGLPHVSVNCYATASKCSWRKWLCVHLMTHLHVQITY